MSGNVFLICLTVIICSVIFAFCHYQENLVDFSDDRYEYLCGLFAELKKKVREIEDRQQSETDS